MEIAALIYWLLVAVLVGAIADSRGRNGGVWFIFAILANLIALVAVLAMPSRVARTGTGEAVSGGSHVRCQACRELIRRDASICPYCRTAQDAKASAPAPAQPSGFDKLRDFARDYSRTV